ncbi:MAG: Nucleic acid binding OB-fold tRNA/helicase-type [Parcubacteria group bacterium Athens1014_10]|nr:MAG: Nucleic acid binding OB-fold tRNA/helicase-type [Parcubacteria group bacterium Athens1014_10]TSD05432.1 MAG: Nucleic acid binding OB-fold tRNA/helicase-type [Parcubacteria group bacterium Athens0714_12]
MPKKLFLSKTLIKICLPVLCLTGFFIFIPKIKATASDDLIISEIQITGGAGQTNNDFIELYNPSPAPINLKGYRLVKRTKTGIQDTNIKSWTNDEFIPAYGFYLWANSDYLPIPALPDATTTASLANDNGIAIRFGKADEGEIIDALAWGEAKNIFIETALFPDNPSANQSIERDLETGIFALQTSPTPRNSRSSDSPPSVEIPPETETIIKNKSLPSGASSGSSTQSFYKPSDVAINEFVSDPADEEIEWIELYNKTSRTIDLNYWTIEDGTEKPKKLEGLSIEPNNFLVLNKGENFTFSLNNAGDIIILKDFSGKIIDQVSYGNFDDGEISDNAPFAIDPCSLARISDGHDTDNDFNDFQLTDAPTKSESNFISQEKNEIFPSSVIINEIFPNPACHDNEKEFIELKNISNQEIDLLDWQIGDSGKRIYVINKNDFKSTIISAQGFFLLSRKQTKIALNNGGDQIKLYWPDDKIADFFEYSEPAKENQSYGRNQKGKWLWSIEPTPGQENIISQPNQTPKAIIEAPLKASIGEEVIFDACDSYDPDGDELSYFWVFDNGLTDDRLVARHIFKKAGIYQISLKVKDSKNAEDETKISIAIEEKSEKMKKSDEKISKETIRGIEINEFLPNPVGAEEEEWIEIYNANDDEINLLNWVLDDQEGGSHPYKISQNLIIAPQEYLIFKRKETKIALNNDVDQVRLFNAQGELVSQASYQKSQENCSYALDKNKKWRLTEILTPLKENIIFLSDETPEIEKIIKLDTEEIKNSEINDLVETQGIVAVEPGILGSQIFYLDGGAQIYCYKKDFPDLKLGDLIKVKGEISQSQAEKRIKIKTQNDIIILERGEPPLVKEVAIEEIGEELKGCLVKINGQLIEKTGDNLYLDNGNEEIKVYIKKSTGIKIPQEIKEGDYLEVSGIVNEIKSEWRLLPRYQNDIIITKRIELQEYLPAGIANIPKIQNQIATKYIILTITALAIIIAGFVFKSKIA